MGSYVMDSHNVQRYVTNDGFVQNEGDVGVSPPRAYQIAFGSLTPRQEECTNLLVPVCVSSSHIAYGSIRMEPVFMILGQSAATAAVLAIEADNAVQDVGYDQLRERLLQDGQVLESAESLRAAPGVAPSRLEGIVVDDEQATVTGSWSHGSSMGKWVGSGYLHDGNARDGKATACFEAKLPTAGRYEVRLAYAANPNRASNVPVVVRHAGGEKTVLVNQKQTPAVDGLFVSLGEFEFSAESPAAVVVCNRDTDGHVIVDAVQWLAK
jgi:hypothetical protein